MRQTKKFTRPSLESLKVYVAKYTWLLQPIVVLIVLPLWLAWVALSIAIEILVFILEYFALAALNALGLYFLVVSIVPLASTLWSNPRFIISVDYFAESFWLVVAGFLLINFGRSLKLLD